MTSPPTNLPNLPIELWNQIFSHATLAPRSCFDSTVIDPVSLPQKMMMWEQPALLADFESWRKPGPYGVRRAFTLVCKSWYFITNPILWKNIRIDLRFRTVINNLCRALEKDHLLAETVLSVVIGGVEYLPHGIKELERQLEKLDTFSKVLPKLKRLKMIQCPRSILERVDWDIMTEVLMAYEKGNWLRRGESFFFGRRFWHHCHTLIITFYATSKHPQQYKNATVEFPNLVNLRIRVRDSLTIEHITKQWSLPRIRNLSISSRGVDSWTKFLERIRLTIEDLELAIVVSSSPVIPPITMPKLSALCLQINRAFPEGGSTLWWIRYITAPRLGKVIFYSILSQEDRSYQWSSSSFCTLIQHADDLGPKVNATLERYPAVREVAVVIVRNRVHTDEKERMGGMVKWKMVTEWCERGLVVEAIDESTGDTRRYTLDDLKVRGQ